METPAHAFMTNNVSLIKRCTNAAITFFQPVEEHWMVSVPAIRTIATKKRFRPVKKKKTVPSWNQKTEGFQVETLTTSVGAPYSTGWKERMTRATLDKTWKNQRKQRACNGLPTNICIKITNLIQRPNQQ